MSVVLAFGTFDPFHEGHRFFLARARALGDALTVVVARDETIRTKKQREPFWREEKRRETVAAVPAVDTALLGDTDPDSYRMLRELDFSVLALGYDQQPTEVEVQRLLASCGKAEVQVVRLPAWHADRYNSTRLRGDS